MVELAGERKNNAVKLMENFNGGFTVYTDKFPKPLGKSKLSVSFKDPNLKLNGFVKNGFNTWKSEVDDDVYELIKKIIEIGNIKKILMVKRNFISITTTTRYNGEAKEIKKLIENFIKNNNVV